MEKQGRPWFKFWAREFLGDLDVANTPDSAMLLIIKMWCVCCLQGSCPADPEQIAKLTRTSVERVLLSNLHMQLYFEQRGDRLFSKRMERDRERSELYRKNAASRWTDKGSGGGSANRKAKADAISNANGPANSSAPEDQKTRGPEALAPLTTERLQEGFSFSPCGKVENSVQNAPRGAFAHEFPGLTETQRAERIQLLKEQAQTLLTKKGNGNSKTEFYPRAAEA
jgi:uncharacterized protein YdaU (DUF1376 family)